MLGAKFFGSSALFVNALPLVMLSFVSLAQNGRAGSTSKGNWCVLPQSTLSECRLLLAKYWENDVSQTGLKRHTSSACLPHRL
jgi:hypothetical protein